MTKASVLWSTLVLSAFALSSSAAVIEINSVADFEAEVLKYSDSTGTVLVLWTSQVGRASLLIYYCLRALLHTRTCSLFLFLSQGCGSCADLLTVLEKAAELAGPSTAARFRVFDAYKPAHKELSDRFAIKGTPVLQVFTVRGL